MTTTKSVSTLDTQQHNISLLKKSTQMARIRASTIDSSITISFPSFYLYSLYWLPTPKLDSLLDEVVSVKSILNAHIEQSRASSQATNTAVVQIAQSVDNLFSNQSRISGSIIQLGAMFAESQTRKMLDDAHCLSLSIYYLYLFFLSNYISPTSISSNTMK